MIGVAAQVELTAILVTRPVVVGRTVTAMTAQSDGVADDPAEVGEAGRGARGG